MRLFLSKRIGWGMRVGVISDPIHCRHCGAAHDHADTGVSVFQAGFVLGFFGLPFALWLYVLLHH
jgi:hypothetical protein